MFKKNNPFQPNIKGYADDLGVWHNLNGRPFEEALVIYNKINSLKNEIKNLDVNFSIQFNGRTFKFSEYKFFGMLQSKMNLIFETTNSYIGEWDGIELDLKKLYNQVMFNFETIRKAKVTQIQDLKRDLG